MSEFCEDVPGPVGNYSSDLPPGWKQHEITDFLTAPQLRTVQSIINSHRSDPDKILIELKKYFKTIAQELEAKGILADFLAYTLYAKIIGAI